MPASTTINYAETRNEGSIATQTWGLLVDAYRELHSKRLFWVTLVLSLLVAGAFMFVGINEAGITVFGSEIPGIWNTTLIPRPTFFRWLFISVAIPWWLGFFAAILALISVAGVFPDMLTSGSVDLYLSRPISRLRLFITKYLFALLFVALQVLVFCTASFVVMGIRGEAWEPGVFLAVPLVTLFFSYLYCVCVLIGMMTRSTLAAILLTVLLWGALFALNVSDGALLAFKTAADQRVVALGEMVERNEDLLRRNTALPEGKRGDLRQFELQRDHQQQQLSGAQDTARKLRYWHGLIVSIKTPLPKTSETVELMGRWLIDPDPFFAAEQESQARREARRAQRRGTTTRPADDLDLYVSQPQTQRRMQEELEARSLGWVVGTSVGFEVIVLSLAGWIFCRRDF